MGAENCGKDDDMEIARIQVSRIRAEVIWQMPVLLHFDGIDGAVGRICGRVEWIAQALSFYIFITHFPTLQRKQKARPAGYF